MTAVGTTFGSWALLSIDSARKRAACRCVCGTVRVVSIEALESGTSTSCGCQQLSAALREEAAQRRQQRNYDWRSGSANNDR
jgi:hypothetical protein